MAKLHQTWTISWLPTEQLIYAAFLLPVLSMHVVNQLRSVHIIDAVI